MQHLKGLCSRFDHFPVINQKYQSVAKWQYLGQMAENDKSEGIFKPFQEMKGSLFFYLLTIGLDMVVLFI